MITTIASRKGGTGKTTTAVNLAGTFALLGKRVLVVDLDPTANATFYLGINPELNKRHIGTLFTDEHVSAREVILHLEYGVDVIPGHISLADSMIGIKQMQIRIVEKMLSTVKDNYDFIVIDTPPSESILTINALVASDNVIIPLQTHPFALETLKQIIDELKDIKDNLNPRLLLAGILPTMHIKNATSPRLMYEQALRAYPEYILPYQIDMRVENQEAVIEGKPLVMLTSNSSTKDAYMQLANKLMEMSK